MKTHKQDNLTIHNADCMEVMSQYKDNYFDFVYVEAHPFCVFPKFRDKVAIHIDTHRQSGYPVRDDERNHRRFVKRDRPQKVIHT